MCSTLYIYIYSKSTYKHNTAFGQQANGHCVGLQAREEEEDAASMPVCDDSDVEAATLVVGVIFGGFSFATSRGEQDILMTRFGVGRLKQIRSSLVGLAGLIGK